MPIIDERPFFFHNMPKKLLGRLSHGFSPSLFCFLTVDMRLMSFFYLKSFSNSAQKIAILIFCYLLANNQSKCSIIYKKITIWAGDDEWIIMSGLTQMIGIIFTLTRSFLIMRVKRVGKRLRKCCYETWNTWHITHF